MRTFAYSRPAAINDAIAELSAPAQQQVVRPLAGGTDLLTLMKQEIVTPTSLIDLKRLPELRDSIDTNESEVTIGALTTLTTVESDPIIQREFTALAEAAGLAATPQLRNMATIAGNLLQRPRCWYFRHSDIACWLKGGSDCPARDGENALHAIFATETSPCVAVHPSDPASALVALNAQIQVRGPAGERSVPIRDFFALPDDNRRTETTLAAGELITSISLPRSTGKSRSVYLKAMDRKVWAFALVGVAVRLDTDAEHVTDASVVLSGVSPIPWDATAATKLVGNAPTAALIDQIADEIVAEAQPLAQNGYKVTIARTLIRRALAQTAGIAEVS